MNRY
jgi:hypothetical protein